MKSLCLAALLAGLLAAAAQAQAQQVPNPISRYSTYPFSSVPFEEMHSVTIGGPYPATAQLTPGIAGFAAKMVVPPSATQTPHPNSSLSSWIISSNTTSVNSSTALIGGSFTKADGANPYGSVLTVCNCDGFNALAGSGHNFQYQVGHEVDIESLSRAGGVAPTGSQVAYLAVSASDIQPAGGSAAFVARDQGTAGGFHYAFYSEDGSSVTAGLRLGAQSQASAGPASNGQNIEFRARTGGVVETARLQYQAGGNLVFFPPPGGSFTTTGHYGSSASAATVSACGTGPVVGTSNDTRGKVKVGTGAGVILCTVTFNTAYAVTPTCVVTLSSNGTATSVGFDSLQPGFMRLAFTGNAASQDFNYVCMQ